MNQKRYQTFGYIKGGGGNSPFLSDSERNFALQIRYAHPDSPITFFSRTGFYAPGPNVGIACAGTSGANCRAHVAGHRAQGADHRAQGADHRAHAADHWAHAADHWAHAAGHWAHAAGHWAHAADHWAHAAGHWAHAADHWAQGANHRAQGANKCIFIYLNK
ncbi:MAG: hypothetical protein LBR86_05600 [Tannerella sp.]|nr:hypothetical protein [Tannerella sp.]